MLELVCRDWMPLATRDIEQPDLCGGGTGVTRTRRGKTVAAIRDLLRVWRVVGRVDRGVIFRQLTRAPGVHIEGIERPIHRVALAGEEKIFAIGTPTGRRIRARVPRELPRAAALGGNDEDVPVAAALAGEGDPISIRRKDRRGVRFKAPSNSPRATPARIPNLNVAAINEREPLAIRTERGLACADDGRVGWRRQLRAQCEREERGRQQELEIHRLN